MLLGVVEWLKWLFTRKATWAVIVMLVVAISLKGYLVSWVQDRLGPASQVLSDVNKGVHDIDEILKDVDAKDKAIISLSQEIEKTHQAALAAVARANALQATLDKQRQESERLRQSTAALQTARKAQPPVRDLKEAQSALQALGY